MSDIRKLLDLLNETTAGATGAGSVASVATAGGPIQKRMEEDEEKPDTSQVIEYGMWENSALTTSNKLKNNRQKSTKVVKSIYGEEVVAEVKSKIKESKTIAEMDKSAPQPGRDGKVSHSTYGSRDKEGSDYFKGKEAPGKAITAKQAKKDALDILKKQGVAEGMTKQARARKEAESVKAAIGRLEQQLKDSNPHIDKDDIRRRLENEKRRLELYRDVLDEQGVAEGSGDKVHLKTPKHGLADHPGRDTGVGLRTFAQTPEQDRCPKCNSLFKNHYKQGVAEADQLQGTPVVSLSDLTDKDYKKNKYGQTVPKKLKQDDPRVKFHKDEKKGVAEGYDEDEGNPVMNAIIGRIMRTRQDLLKHGLQKLQAAIRDVAEFAGDVDEIGSSDVSGWVKQVEQRLSNEMTDEGVIDTLKKVGKKVIDVVAPDDEALLKDLQKKAGIPQHAQHGKKRMAIPNDEKLDEQDLILNPSSISKRALDLIPHEQKRTDHEVEMAKSDIYQAGKNAAQIFNLIRNVSEEDGLEGWVQEKIIKASDYLNTVREYLETRTAVESMDGVGPSTRQFTSEDEKPGLWANIHAKRERIKGGSGEHMRKPGSKGAPTAKAFKDSAKTSKK